MRGKIIQYNGADGTGTIVAEGKQYRFALSVWRGNNAPAVNKTVEIALEGETVTAVAMVGEDVLIKEKAAELGGKLGAMLNKASASVSTARAAHVDAAADGATAGAAPSNATVVPASAPGAITAQSIIERYGKLLLAAYVLFLLGTLAFNAISVSIGPGLGKSLFEIASLMSQMGASGGGMIKVLLLAGYVSIALPMLWRDRRAWLVLAIPLIAVLWAVFSAMHSISSVGGGTGQGMSDFFSIDFGFYLSLAAAIVLAVLGVKRFISAA